MKKNKPTRPIFLSYPIVSVNFYKNKINTIFKENDDLKVRQTIFKLDRIENKISDYMPEHKEKIPDMLLEII